MSLGVESTKTATQTPPCILYGIDNAYLVQAAVSLSSLLRCNRNTHFDVHIAAFERNRELSNAILSAVLHRYPNAAITFHDLDDTLFRDLRVTGALSRSTYTRLGLNRFIGSEHDRVLYLDADTVICGD